MMQTLKTRWQDWREQQSLRQPLPTHWGYPSAQPRHNLKEVGIDWPLIGVTLTLLMIGFVMVYSTTIAYPSMALYKAYKPYHFIINHSAFIVLAMVLACTVFFVPFKWLEKASYMIALVAIGLLVAVLVFGASTKGSQRWLNLGAFNIQPSEVLKLSTILAAAYYVSRRYKEVQTTFVKALLPTIAYLGVVGVLLMLQPDMGSLMVVTVIAFGILFLGGLKLRIIALTTVGVVAVFGIILFSTSWRTERVQAFLDPWAPEHAMNKAYQVTNSLIGMGRGGIWGVGLGDSLEKLQWLPEAHTDYIFSIFAEEMGLTGVILLILLFAWLIQRMFKIGRQAILLDRLYAGLVAQGAAVWLGFQTVFNLAVTMGLVPTKGLTLPFISYGGSALLVSTITIALVLRVDHDNRQLMRGRPQ